MSELGERRAPLAFDRFTRFRAGKVITFVRAFAIFTDLLLISFRRTNSLQALMLVSLHSSYSLIWILKEILIPSKSLSVGLAPPNAALLFLVELSIGSIDFNCLLA